MGTEKDESEAVRLFRIAAFKGVPEAQFKMAVLTQEGAVPDEGMSAKRWYEAAAESGLAVAKFNLGTMYYEGNGAERDPAKAFELYKEVSETGDGDALFMVGRMLFEGIGVEKDPEEGLKYFGLSANAGNPMAMEFVENLRRRQNTQLIKIDGTERDDRFPNSKSPAERIARPPGNALRITRGETMTNV